MSKKAIQTTDAPKAIGPYSQAVRSGRLLFCSGQLGLGPDSGALVAGGARAEAEQALRNLEAVLTAAGASWAEVVKTTIYLTNLNDFDAVNAVYAEHVKAVAPARATVQVAALPKGAVVEIEAVAHLKRKS